MDSILDVTQIKKEVLDLQMALSEGKNVQEKIGVGIALLKDFSKGSTSSGKEKYSGHISNHDDISFMVWNNKAAFSTLDSGELNPKSVVEVRYSLTKFGMILESIKRVQGYDPEQFILHRYDCREEQKKFCEELRKSDISTNANSVIELLLHMKQGDDFGRRFAREQAGNNNHDAVECGLIAHTRKTLQLYNGIKPVYSFLNDSFMNDLMVVSICLHDIGKIYEMHDGIYQKYSYITHRGIGLELIFASKEKIIDFYSEEFYYQLLSVIQQHHDEYGEPAKTLAARVVHLLDDLDAQFTSIDEAITSGEYTTDCAGSKIKLHDRYFTICDSLVVTEE